ncbi:AAA family ATPase [Delftia acidovorans]|uniref:AAA family ATPase n=1 Tax=Delftia acidovorans TaxID=80866 RepID=UPI0022AB7ECF|nr:ATP-binding protein [Delftia acidovorans]WAT83203.1 ATP-binding protein [Delftia acidovorans]
MTDKKTPTDEIAVDFATLARLAAAQAYDDVRLLLARLIRKYRVLRPELAVQLDQSLKASQTRAVGGSALRRETSGHVSAPQSDAQLSLIKVFDDLSGMAAPLLSSELERQVDAIVIERRQRETLLARGIPPTRSAILVGAPGLGKTLSARWIAHQLGKPLWVLDLTAVMSSLLGKTGSNLRAALDHAKASSAVLLLDEVDAIAKRRSDESDIGELKRLVTVILQEVDQWPDTGLLLAATNHPELVDPALWRRFDVVLNFSPPDTDTTGVAVRRFLGQDLLELEPWVGALAVALQGQSLSEVERAVNSVRRAHALQQAPIEELVERLVGPGIEGMDKAQRLEMAVQMARSGRLSHQEINRLTGVARDTIRKHAGPSPRRGRGMK